MNGAKGRNQSAEKDLHGDHLHMSPLQISVQLALVGVDEDCVVTIEMVARQSVAETGRIDAIRFGMLLVAYQARTFLSAHV